MKNTIRCCISCILPCGALDVIRIVHPNGHVEELSCNTTAAEILKLHPRHVLKKHTSTVSDEEQGSVCHRIVVVSPESKLQRGKIYFLIPLPDQKRSAARSSRTKRRKIKDRLHQKKTCKSNNVMSDDDDYGGGDDDDVRSRLLTSDRYLSEILSEKVTTQRDRRRGRVAVWRPHLESISETPSTEV